MPTTRVRDPNYKPVRLTLEEREEVKLREKKREEDEKYNAQFFDTRLQNALCKNYAAFDLKV
jgi:hypothetical protein